MSQVPHAPRAGPRGGGVFFSPWQVALIACFSAAVTAGVVVFAYHVKGQNTARGGAAAGRAEADSPSAKGEVVGEGESAREAPTASKKKSPPAADPPDGKSVEGLRTALGTLTGVGIRQAYLNVGLLADGVEGEVYEVADATKVLDSVEALVSTMDRQLGGLSEKAFEAEDRESVELARKVLRLLRTQTKELRTYWQDKSKEAAERFQAARAESWAAIKELLDLDD
jgi:hypothetical protein